jgi:hypothetical protein
MAIMGSSNLKNDLLYDPIRKKWVEKTSEEAIRQDLIHQMIEKLGYPAPLIAVEKELAQLPNLRGSGAPIPKRRADIVVYAKQAKIYALKAILMIECKAVPLTPKFAQQVIGYNAFVGAEFIALANETQVLTGFFDVRDSLYKFEPGLPLFKDLMLYLNGTHENAHTFSLHNAASM